jgi:hypothetical protein
VPCSPTRPLGDLPEGAVELRDRPVGRNGLRLTEIFNAIQYTESRWGSPA